MIKKIFKSFLFQRLLISGIVYFSTLYMAKKMGAGLYGQLAFVIFFIKSLPSMNLGISYGFIFHSYKSTQKTYEASYISGYLCVSLIALLIGSVMVSPYIFFFGSILLAIFIFDPFLKIKRFFLFSLFPELFLTLSCAISYTVWNNEGMSYFVSVIILLLLLVCGTLYFYKHLIFKEHSFKLNQFVVSLKQVKELIIKGHASYISQLAFFFFLFADRYLLNEYYPQEMLGICMLAFQFCQASLYVMSSWNFSSVVEIGELIKTKQLNMVFIVKKLLTAAVVGALPLIAFYFILLQTEDTYFKDYPDIALIFAIIAIGVYFCNLANSISPILFFFEKQFIAAIGLIICVLVVFISYTYGAANGKPYFIVLQYNYIALAISSLYTIFYALFVLHNVTSVKEEALS